MTRSQIRNRKKKEKKLKALEEEKEKEKISNGDGVTSSEAPGEPKSSEKQVRTPEPKKKKEKKEKKEKLPPSDSILKPPQNGIASDTSPVPEANGVSNTIESSATHQPPKPKITNGIKHSPSPSTTSVPKSPPIPVTSSPQPDIPAPTSINELRARLNERISQARVARKAVDKSISGGPQTREAILEARARRKAKVTEKINAKKALKGKEGVSIVKKEEESSDEDEIIDPGLNFGRVMVHGEEVDLSKGEVKTNKKKKGPMDPKARLKHLLKREERLKNMDEEKNEKAIEHDRWKHALLSTRGEKVKDDISLVKKTVARREREKKKSKKQWDERLANIERQKEERQKKRTDNIARRRDDKLKKRLKIGKKVKKPSAKKGRPGFEGGRRKLGRK